MCINGFFILAINIGCAIPIYHNVQVERIEIREDGLCNVYTSESYQNQYSAIAMPCQDVKVGGKYQIIFNQLNEK